MRPTRAEILVDNFQHNLLYVRERIGPDVKIMAIVKANAYGHGLEIIAKQAVDSGEVHAFGVATEEEGVKLRSLTSLPILLLTTVLADSIDTLIKHDLDFTLTDPALITPIASRVRALGKKARVHLKVDTGMRRVGVAAAEAIPILHKLKAEHETIDLIGLSTHFATSDELASSFFTKQLTDFKQVVQEVRHAGISIPLVHAANSGAILQHPKESGFDMVRPGIMLYGYTPNEELDAQYGAELRPVLELVSTVVFKKRVDAGEGVSYNLRWRAPKETTVLTVPIGYGDGYPRSLTNRAEAAIRGKNYPVVGTICMDQVMIDVGNDDVETGERVVFLSSKRNGITAWTLARLVGTIPYEILTNIAARVPRIEIPVSS